MLFYIVDRNGDYSEIYADSEEQAEHKMHNMFSEKTIKEFEMEVIEGL